MVSTVKGRIFNESRNSMVRLFRRVTRIEYHVPVSEMVVEKVPLSGFFQPESARFWILSSRSSASSIFPSSMREAIFSCSEGSIPRPFMEGVYPSDSR